jgi:hypothetical protein
MEEMMDDELMVPFDKRNAAMLNEMGFSITDEPGYGEIASVEGEMAVHVLQLANGRLRLSIDLPDGSVINADIVGRHRADCPSLERRPHGGDDDDRRQRRPRTTPTRQNRRISGSG